MPDLSLGQYEIDEDSNGNLVIKDKNDTVVFQYDDASSTFQPQVEFDFGSNDISNVGSLNTGTAIIESKSETQNDSKHFINQAAPSESGISRSYLEYTGEAEEQIFGEANPGGGLLLIREAKYDEMYLGHFAPDSPDYDFLDIKNTSEFSTTDDTVSYYLTLEGGTLKLVYDGGTPRRFHATLIS